MKNNVDLGGDWIMTAEGGVACSSYVRHDSDKNQFETLLTFSLMFQLELRRTQSNVKIYLCVGCSTICIQALLVVARERIVGGVGGWKQTL